MKKLILFIAAVFSASAQTPQLTLTGPSSAVRPGTSATLTLSITGTGTTGLADLQALIANPGGTIGNVTVTCAPGAAATAASKQVVCNYASGTLSILVAGVNSNALGDGVVATIVVAVPIQASGSIPISMTGLLAATNQGFFQSANPPAVLTIALANVCDANNDGVVDAKDWQLYATGINTGNTSGLQDLDSDGKITVTDLQRVANAVTGSGCKVN